MSFITSPGVIVPPLTAGGVAYGTGSQAKMNNAGTVGQALLSGGAGVPTWGQAGSFTLLSTVTANNSATVDVESTFNSTYDAYLMIASGVTPQNNNTGMRMEMKLSGSYVTSSTYLWFYQNAIQSSLTFGFSSSTTSDTNIQINNGFQGNAASDGLDFQLSVYNPSNTSFFKLINWTGVSYMSSVPRLQGFSGFGVNNGSGAALTGLRFYFASGNIKNGSFRLYGIANTQ